MKNEKHWLWSDNPTPNQRANRIIWNRKKAKMRRYWRAFKKEGELMIPFISGLIIFGIIILNFLYQIG
tara:strand:- start:65 stop:268 length:204 start_codon:yes stop_codon:yes gene_type:complete